MRILIRAALATMAIGAACPAYALDLADKWTGTYSCEESHFVTVKRLTFTKEKNRSIKIQGALVGFPDEVSIGEATAEPYADRSAKNDPNVPNILLANFSSEKYKPLIIIQPIGNDGGHPAELRFTCYMRDVDGTRIYFVGNLTRQK